jgi:rhamnose transport system permease protein
VSVVTAYARLRSLARWESGLVVILILVLIFAALTSSQLFFTSGNVFYLGLNVGEIAIIAVPMSLLMIAGEIDLSVGSTAGMAGALTGFLWMHGWQMPLIIVFVLVVGAAAGLLNGFLVTRWGLPSLIVTIGGLIGYRGVAEILLGSNTVSTFPNTYTNMGVSPVPLTPLPFSIVVFAVLALLFGLVLHTTYWGRSIYAIGANPEAARYSGIRVKRVKMSLFVSTAVVASLAGMLLDFRLATAINSNATGYELDVVAIVLFGGVAFEGGRGTMIGVVLGAVIFATIQNSLLLVDFNQEAAGIVTGSLLLLSVLVPRAPALLRQVREAASRSVAARSRLEPAAAVPIAEAGPPPHPHPAKRGRGHGE